MAKADILKSKYTKGVWFVQGQEWKVGERYEILKLLGSGSFSSVCLALDNVTGEKVAIKRVGDVLSSPEQAKKVLREICILRRLRFPFLIALYDAFIRPSSSGPCKLIGGELVPSSIDVYIVMEFGEEGDLFNLRGQLTAAEVRQLTWQLLQALKYLHSNNVWHRDIKSANILLKRDARGKRIIKVADFGSARSASQEGYHWAEQGPPEPRNAQLAGPNSLHTITAVSQLRGSQDVYGHLDSFHGGQSGLPPHIHPVDSFNEGLNRVQPGDLYVQLKRRSSSAYGGRQVDGGCGFVPPLTRTVATPCYRAPEVVMSRGGYTSAIDMWSAGCILGELLQRVTTVGSATTPHLQVAPLFAIHGMPKTPGENDTFVGEGGVGNSTTRSELMALFDVIGTPCWADVESVQSPAWRNYLRGLPGRAPSLYRRLGFTGEVTVNLLERMLAFDPARRCTAEEALAHEYLEGITDDIPLNVGGALAEAESALQDMDLDLDNDGRRYGEETKRQRSSTFGMTLTNSFEQAAKKVCSELDHQASTSGEMPSTPKKEEAGAAPMEAWRERHYWEEADPAAALAMLEDEMAELQLPGDSASPTDEQCRSCQGMSRLRRLLEDECAAQAAQGALMVQRQREGRAPIRIPSFQRTSSGEDGNLLAAWAGTPAYPGLAEDRYGLEEQDPAEFGKERLNYVADRAKGKLDPAEHLTPGRHGEWTTTMGIGSTAPPSMAWGVSVLPPGVADPSMQEAIRRQQAR